MLEQMFCKRRSILVDYSQLNVALKALDEVQNERINKLGGLSPIDFFDLHVANCGWKKAPDCWFISWHATEKTWYRCLHAFKKYGVYLLPETTGC